MIRLCSILLVVILGTAAAYAGEPTQTTQRVLKSRKGTHSFILSQYINEYGGKEIQVEHQEVRRFLPDTRTIVMWGRDTDQDGRFDAWFYHGESGVIESWDLPSWEEDGWDAAEKLLKFQVNVA